MKKNLGLIGMLICSTGLLALPAAAQERGTRSNLDSRQYGSSTYSQSYDQRRSDTWQRSGERYSQNSPNYSGQYARNAQNYGGYSAYGFEDEHNSRTNRDRDFRRTRDHHERRDLRHDDWDWR